ncbi:sensor histidine kinase [Actinoplanes sp. CA-030573]|uniref:sensor histidine kinase n=1 Tax=Actinoplanes sp. CA-030573 TaxID=3239898 RepID=UPI003D8FDCE8
MSRFEPRRLLTDAALALVLLVLTLAPGVVTRMVSSAEGGKAGDPLAPADSGWWLFAALVLAGLLIRQHHPVTALVLVSAGTFGHLVLQTKFQLLDLALPLVLYTVAATARRRRLAFGVLVLVMVLTWFAMLVGRIGLMDEQKQAMLDKQQQQVGAVATQVKIATAPKKVFSVGVMSDVLIDTSQQVLEVWLLSVAAFAVGDSMRSRRAHLAAIEQRAADLAREERQRAALAVAAERARITRELHDVVAHGMSVMVVQAQGAAAALERHPDRTADALQHVIDVGRSSLAEMRRLLDAGRTDPAGETRLAPLPGIGEVPALVDQLRAAGMRVELVIEGVPDAPPAAVDLSAYRIVQEALTNTLKHAGAGAGARVLLDFRPDAVRVEVVDDGAGLADGADGRGNGLRGIAERVAMLGGQLSTGRGPDGCGYRLAATLPRSALMAARP